MKYFAIVSSARLICSKAVFLLADDKLVSDEFYCYELQSTTFKLPDVTNIYICFTKSRSGNAAFFNWLTENVVLNWVLEIQQECSPDNNHAMVCMDGEHDQIESLKKDSIVSLLNDNNIHVCKLPASTTAVSQACDAGSLFRALKAKLLHNLSTFQPSELQNKALTNVLEKHYDMTSHQLGSLRTQFVKGVCSSAIQLTQP